VHRHAGRTPDLISVGQRHIEGYKPSLEIGGVRQLSLLLPLHPQAIKMQQILLKDQRVARKDHSIVPLERNFPKTNKNPHQVKIPALRHPIATVATQSSLLAV
jgi:hypothetical protein